MNIDILMAVYNAENYVSEQIQSILNQDYGRYRLVIRDNCSTDNTRSIIKKFAAQYPDKFFLIESKKNVGALQNFSALLESSREHYVMFSDHDDYWLPKKISLSVAKMRELEQLYGKETPLLVHTDLLVADSSLTPIFPSFWKFSNITPAEGRYPLSRQLVQNTITGNTMLINRKLVELVGSIPSEAIMHDWWIGLCASAFGAIGCVKTQTILYRQHSNNQIGAESSKIFFGRKKNRTGLKHSLAEQGKAFSNKFDDLLSKNQKEILKEFQKFIRSCFFLKLKSMLKYGFFKQGFLRNVKEVLEINSVIPPQNTQ